MKALIPFILPLVVLIILGFGFWQWVQNNSQEPAISDDAVSVEVTEVDQGTQEELTSGGTADVPTVEMTPPENAPEEAEDATAQIRYQINDKVVSLLVLATIPRLFERIGDIREARAQDEVVAEATSQPTTSPSETKDNSEGTDQQSADKAAIMQALESGQKFYVWIKPNGKETLTRAFVLEDGKGGLMGSASIPVEALPMEVYVTTAEKMVDVPQNTWLKGTIPAPTPN